MKNRKKRSNRRINYLTRKSERIMKELQKNNKLGKVQDNDSVENSVFDKSKEVTHFKTFGFKDLEILEKSDFKVRDVWYKFKTPNFRLNVPENFSFTENPDESIGFLRNLFTLILDKKTKEIQFDHSQCSEMDIAASAVMDTIVLNSEKIHFITKVPFGLRGILPGTGYVRDLLLVSGIVKQLGISKEPKPAHIHTTGLIMGEESDVIATKLTNFYKRSLKTQSVELNDLGEIYIAQMIGEVANNCKLHGGEMTSWYSQGHYFMRENDSIGECRIVIFNYGQSIYSRLKSVDTTRVTMIELNELTRVHKPNFDSNWNEEALWTLYSLQDGVSRMREEHGKNADRGSGTMHLIDHFLEIGQSMNDEYPVMSLTSGRIHITFDGSYRLLTNDEGRKVIAFNDNNDLTEKPNLDYIKILENGFPGTVISMKFYLDKKFLKSREGD